MSSSLLRASLLLPLWLVPACAASMNADPSLGIVDTFSSSRAVEVQSGAGGPLPVAASPRPGLPDQLVGFDTSSVAVDMALFRSAQPVSPHGSRGMQEISDVGKYFEVEFSLFADDEPFRMFAPLAILACLAFAGIAVARRFGTR